MKEDAQRPSTVCRRRSTTGPHRTELVPMIRGLRRRNVHTANSERPASWSHPRTIRTQPSVLRSAQMNRLSLTKISRRPAPDANTHDFTASHDQAQLPAPSRDPDLACPYLLVMLSGSRLRRDYRRPTRDRITPIGMNSPGSLIGRSAFPRLAAVPPRVLLVPASLCLPRRRRSAISCSVRRSPDGRSSPASPQGRRVLRLRAVRRPRRDTRPCEVLLRQPEEPERGEKHDRRAGTRRDEPATLFWRARFPRLGRVEPSHTRISAQGPSP